MFRRAINGSKIGRTILGWLVLERFVLEPVLAGGGLRIAVELLAGYNYAQVFAPTDGEYVALEPMTAPTNALVSGSGLQIVEPGGTFRAVFRISVEG